jgi:hypothetical protein
MARQPMLLDEHRVRVESRLDGIERLRDLLRKALLLGVVALLVTYLVGVVVGIGGLVVLLLMYVVGGVVVMGALTP